MVLKRFHDGVMIPEYGVRIPWLITEPELFQLVPRSAFTFSLADWPMLQCTVLGINDFWGFNFVSHPDDRLIAIRYENLDPGTIISTFETTSKYLIVELGTPNRVNLPDSRLRWQDEWGCVTNDISTGFMPSLGRETTSHAVSIYALSLNPRTRKGPLCAPDG